MHNRPISIAAAFAIAFASAAIAQDPARDALEQAHRQFRSGRESAKGTLLEALKKAEQAAKTDEQRARIATDLAAFTEHGTLPATAPVAARAFERKVAQLVATLQKAQVDAIVRLRKEGLEGEAARVEERMEKTRSEMTALLARDLRCQIDTSSACLAGTWDWSGTSLRSAAEAPGALKLFSDQRFPASYELTLEIERASGTGILHIAFPYAAAGRQSLGFLAVSSEDIALAANSPTATEASFHRAELLGENRRVRLSLRLEDGVFKLAIGDHDALAMEVGNLTPGPESLANMVKDGKSPFVIPTDGSCFLLHHAKVLDLDAGTAAAPAKPQQVLAQGSTWEGEWDSSGSQAGVCRSITVTSRTNTSLVLEVQTNHGAVFSFTFKVAGNKLTLVDMNHIRTANRNGTKMAFDDVSGSGAMTDDSFSFNFKVRRIMPKLKDEWTGTIKGTAPK